ncbi:carbohydrate ABC transporter permease [Cohnella hongkongensis]|uniref:Carbohydrate ABC transporter permease n=1 Tax=Cohnella hongkongensis TaxID=178337 RepID=A0ABV9F9X9_9BACL
MRLKRLWVHIPIVAILIFVLGPLLLMLNNALKPAGGLNDNPFHLPERLVWTNFSDAWVQGEYARAFGNSVLVGISCILIICVSAGLAAYALAKLRFKGSNAVMGLLLFTMSIPLGLFLVPLFYLWQKFNLMDTLGGMILIYSAIFLPFSIFMLRAFLVKIPNELIESAKIDGCSETMVLLKMIVPIAKSAFMTLAVLVSLWTWNEFFFANAFLISDETRTVATRYLAFSGRYSSDWTLISAAGVITTAPILILYLLLQRRFVEGLVEGSVKG